MAAHVVDLVAAVAAHIRSSTYSFTFNVQETKPQQSDLRDTRLTTVYVYPKWDDGKQLPIDTREDFGRQYTIMVHIVNFVDDPDAEREINDALLLSEELEQSLENVDFAPFSMLQFLADAAGQTFLELEQLNDRNTFHVPTAIQYVTV